MLNDHSCNNCRPNQPSGSFFFLICDDRYCCWGKPFWWFEGSLLLHPQGDLKQTFSKMYTFLFPRAHCLPLLARMWPTCTLVFRCVGIFYHSGWSFSFSDWLCVCQPSKWCEGGVPLLPQQKWSEQAWCMWWGSTGMSKVWASKMVGLLGRSEP